MKYYNGNKYIPEINKQMYGIDALETQKLNQKYTLPFMLGNSLNLQSLHVLREEV